MLGDPPFRREECQLRGITFATPLRACIRLDHPGQRIVRRRSRKCAKTEVYMGEIPPMTGNGSFIINGTERVIVSQLHRSPGVFFEHDRGKTSTAPEAAFFLRPRDSHRGSWLDFEFDPKDLLYFRIDRRRKMPVSILMPGAIGYSEEQIGRILPASTPST